MDDITSTAKNASALHLGRVTLAEIGTSLIGDHFPEHNSLLTRIVASRQNHSYMGIPEQIASRTDVNRPQLVFLPASLSRAFKQQNSFLWSRSFKSQHGLCNAVLVLRSRKLNLCLRLL